MWLKKLSARRAIVLGLIPYAVLAQSAPEAWSNLGQLRVGRKIRIADMKLKSVEGKFAAFSEDAISLLTQRGQVSIPRANVFSVKNLERSHRARNTLLGLAIGAAGGAAAGAIKGATFHEAGETGVFMLVFTPIGAGIGAGVGAALPAGSATVYRAKARTTPP
jgi:hypothetical protein